MHDLKIKIEEKVTISEFLGDNIKCFFQQREESDNSFIVQLPEYALIILEKIYSGLGSFSNSPNTGFKISYEKSRYV